MTLQKKILVIITALFVLIAGALLWITDRFVMRSFLRLEAQDIEKNVLRAENAVATELDNLKAIGGDWGPWNETRDFLLKQNDDYIRNNLQKVTLANLRMDFIVFLNNKEAIVHSAAIDHVTDDFGPAAAVLQQYILGHPDLLFHRYPKDSKTGIILIGQEPALITSWPITNSNFERPIHGTLIMGRFLTPAEIQNLRQKTKLSIHFVDIHGNQPPELEQVHRQLTKGASVAILTMAPDLMSGYKGINDIHGNPCLLLRVDLGRDIVKQGRESVYYFMTAILIAGALMVLILFFLLQKIVINPITRLERHILSIQDTKNLTVRLKSRRKDEIGILTNEFNQMVMQLEEKSNALSAGNQALQLDITKRKAAEEELRRTNQILQRSLSDLKETQDQLVQSEKMASLGGLVAGVAHEINTPLSIAITAASLLQDRTLELISTLKSQPLESLDHVKLMKLITETSDLISRNLKRVAELVVSFKQVSVDQFSDQHRWFEVKNYIDQLVLTLKPKFQGTGHAISVQCPDRFEINSSPGAFAQILTQLITNSIMHGFESMAAGRIEIIVRREADSLILIYSDNGKGMDKETLAKMFDPFFTTKRGQGGTGLGMHILYNLVTHSLQGKLECTSTPGQGVFFLIRIPLDEKRIRYN